MPTLYTQVETNIRKTWFLMSCFLVFTFFLGWLFSYLFENQIFLIAAITIAFLQSFFSYWYSDKIVLALTKAKRIEKRDNPELYRIVENLCITAGLPTPKIYILEESQPNAFATGRDKNNAAIVLTRGLLEKLEKPELEGVISHELAHIGNRDILLQSIVVVLVGAIALLSEWFLRISRFSRPVGKEKEERGAAIFFLFGILAALLAPIVAQLIHFAISRKREFLADATGALLTRYPEGLARALEKISKDQNSLKVANFSTAHLFIVNPFKGKKAIDWFAKLFSTHPPIEERIKILREMSV